MSETRQRGTDKGDVVTEELRDGAWCVVDAVPVRMARDVNVIFDETLAKSRDEMLAYAEDRGIEVDKRWGDKRLFAAITADCA